MDYIFEEDLFEVGTAIDAYCSRCKTDTPHTVVSKYEDEIRSVLCSTCNTTHAYRPPRGDSEEEIPEPLPVRRRQMLQKLPWKEAMQQLSTSAVRIYSPKESYAEGEVLDHPKFALGYVSEILSNTKLEAIFKDGHRILVHNRVDLTIPAEPSKRKGGSTSAAKHPDKEAQKHKEIKEIKESEAIISSKQPAKIKLSEKRRSIGDKSPVLKPKAALVPSSGTKARQPKGTSDKASSAKAKVIKSDKPNVTKSIKKTIHKPLRLPPKKQKATNR